MYIYIIIISCILIAAALIILAVLAQNPKGGMAANFGVSNQVMGARQTSDFLEKFTWGLAVTILVLSLAATMSIPKDKITASKSAVDNSILNIPDQTELAFPNQMSFPVEEPAEIEPAEE